MEDTLKPYNTIINLQLILIVISLILILVSPFSFYYKLFSMVVFCMCCALYVLILSFKQKNGFESKPTRYTTTHQLLFEHLETYVIPFQHSHTIPKIIWSYWEGSPSRLAEICIQSWKKQNPDFVIIVLDRCAIKTFIPELTEARIKFLAKDHIAKVSDAVRLCLVAKYGGYWVDATILMMHPLDRSLVTQQQQSQFVGFYLEEFTTNPKHPVIESWMFASPPSNPFVIAWKDAFMTFLKCPNPRICVQRMTRAEGIDIQKIKWPVYLYIHVAAQFVLQKMHHVCTDMLLHRAEDGPYKYLIDNNWSIQPAIKSVVANPAKYPLVKFRSIERRAMTTADFDALERHVKIQT